jgi:alcohol dehydrogenase (cytochrome c)
MLVSLCAALAGAATPGQAAEALGAGDQWTTPAGTLQGTRYSTLADIDAGNVSTLVEEFRYPTGVKAGHQGQPLVVGNTMYVVTPFPNKLIALDLSHPGTAKWTFNPGTDIYARGVACCDVVNRGAAYADGKIVWNLLDGHTVAVDATTGTQVWRTALADPTSGETLTGAPLIVGNKVIVGNAGGELGIRGWVQALDLATGKPVWKAYATGPDKDVLIGAGFHPFYAKDRGTDLGVTTWPGTTWKQGGSTSWGWITYDPDLKLVYYGTGNPGVWNPDMRPGDNKWGATIWARNPDTGAAVWAYQLTPHDGWDFDAMSESIVVDIQVGGVKRKVLQHIDKNGFAYLIDRATGEVISAPKLGLVTWADHVDLATGLPRVNPGFEPHQGKITSNICPSPLGIKEWAPAAFSPVTDLVYVPAINFCDALEPLKALYIAGTPFMGANTVLSPGPGGYMGELVAWSPATGKRAWSLQETLPVYSGVLATRGNLVFYGTLDGWFKAANAATGQVLFSTQLECGIIGSPIAYTAPDGRERVAVYTGTGWLAGGFAGGPCPASGDGGNAVEGAASPLAAAVAGLQLPQGKGRPAAPTSGAVHVFKLP